MAAGDHLRVNRGGEVDHAIDVGDRTVIRWRAGAGLERVERAVFAPDGSPVEVVLHRERVYRPALVVARAFSRFSEAAYRAMFQSPEQFAAWCKSAQLPAVAAPEAPVARRAAPARKAAPAAKAKSAPAARARTAKKAKVARKLARKPAPKKVAKKPAAKKKAAPRKPAARKVAKAKPTKKGARRR